MDRSSAKTRDSVAEAEPDVPGLLGDYTLLARVARGGMADIYVAERTDRLGSECFYAVKVLMPRLAQRSKFVDMFKAEGRLGLLLVHPNIVRTVELGSEGPIQFISMEYIEGHDLSRVLRFFRRAGAPVPVNMTLLVLTNILRGLEYAHSLEDVGGRRLDLVNRDISPANIMLGYDCSIQLIDFGIAQTLLDYRTQIGSIKGKIVYMSPEQVRGLALDARSDLFSLGTIAYQLLTGREPFRAATEFEQMENVREASPPRANELNPRLDQELSDIVARAMTKDPADRFQSAGEMGEAFRAYIERSGLQLDSDITGRFLRDEFGGIRAGRKTDIEEARRALRAPSRGKTPRS